MSFITKKSNVSRWLIGFIFAGVLLRILGIWFFPPGMEGDEVVVLYWGRKLITEGHWVLIHVGELPAWETPSAYIFGALDLWGINPRWGAVGISAIELWLCYLWTKKRAGPQTALLATSFLSLMPWHFYFSYILGPCVAGLWTSLYLLDIQNPLGRVLGAVGGLFYYVSFRVLLLWGGLKNLCLRRWRPLILDIGAAVLGIFILFLLGPDHLQGFFNKGSYLVTERGPVEWLHHYLNSAVLWWTPPLQVYWGQLTMYSMDDVGFGFANALGFQSPLSWGTSLFFAWGIYIAFKTKSYRDIVWLFALTLVLVGFSPSYVHFPFILPVVAFIAAVGANRLLNQNEKAFKFILLSLVIATASIVLMMTRLQKSDRWGTFSGHTEALPPLVLAETSRQNFVWSAGYEFYRARLAADRAKIPFTGFDQSHAMWMRDIRSQLKENQSHWVFIQSMGSLEHPRPEKARILQEFARDLTERTGLFEVNFNIKNKKEIRVDGSLMGVLYELAD